MFQTIRYRLLLSYLVVLTVILAVFAIAVRLTFAHSLRQELADRLAILAKAASGELDLEGEELAVDPQNLLLNPNQAIQWFDTKGHLIDEKGNHPLTLPFDPKQKFLTQTLPYPAQGITLPVQEEERNDRLIGYVRASESFEGINETLRQLDWGLGGGIILALALSGIGGIWLTRQAMQPIEKSFQRLQQFTADASHELRNPLMAIKSNATVALKYPEGIRESDAEKFRAIASASGQMTRLTEDLLFLARNDKVLQGNRDTVNLTSILCELVQLNRPQANDKQINLKSQLTEDLYLLGDSSQLMQLFTNLLQNAIDYTRSGGTVEITANSVDFNLVIEVKDTGVGIAAEYIDKIFERFWREDKSRSYHSGGSGLGLAIAQTIARNHGGKIIVTSQVGVGSCFTVWIPVNISC